MQHDVMTLRHPQPQASKGALLCISPQLHCSGTLCVWWSQVILFAHPHRKSNWHSTENLDYNINHVNWDKVPGFALLHRQGLFWEVRLQAYMHSSLHSAQCEHRHWV